MTTPYSLIPDLTATPVPDDGILSRTLYDDDQVRVIFFGFAVGEELSEHTASMPAMLHFWQGEAALTLGEDHHDAQPGTWAHMPAHLPHSIRAITPTVMILYLLKQG
ncbi:MAG: cupin domain-containing protein [Anaerolineae bacterium]|nr:cupin domain-containing protein [Anaerolineae bacterium]